MGENNEQGNGDFDVQSTALLEKDISEKNILLQPELSKMSRKVLRSRS